MNVVSLISVTGMENIDWWTGTSVSTATASISGVSRVGS
jgi:hypothetical protein